MAPPTNRTTVAIVEDDEVLRESLAATVSASPDFEVLEPAATFQQALVLCEQKPCVFLIDLSLPDGSGFDLIVRLRATVADCKAIVISVFADVESVVRAIELGADGYLLKGAGLEQVAAAIHSVLSATATATGSQPDS